MIGVIRSVTSAVTRAAKAIPITIPTAMSTRLPRSRNVRNSFMSACIGVLLGFDPVEGLSRLLRDRVQLVADAVARLDERVPRRAAVDLLPHLADEDVDGPVAMRLATAPHALEELVARDDPAAFQRERVQEPELRRRQAGGVAVEVRLDLIRVDAEFLDLDRLAARRLLRPHAAPRRGLHARDELLHREGLHEVVVGPDLESMDPVVLGAARADDDDRRADAVAARSLDDAPAVGLRDHQVEDADVGPLVAEAREPLLALRPPERVEARRRQVPRHALADDLVVLDDEHLGHLAATIMAAEWPGG